jgi:hypothetical protein
MKIRSPITSGVAAFTDAACLARQRRWNCTRPVAGSRPTSPVRVRNTAYRRPAIVAPAADE